MRNQFGLKPKEPTYMYQRPYPEAYDQIAMPHRYRVSHFTKFSGHDNVRMIEHISKFLIQCGEAYGNDALKIRVVFLIASKLFHHVDRYGEIVPQILLCGSSGDEAYRSDSCTIEER
jgi:hypothetical protein